MTDLPVLQSIDDERCHVVQTHLEVLGRKWNSGILLAAARGAERFSEYRGMIIGISDRLLAVRLRELEAEGFIARTVEPTTPVSIRYRPTERGLGLLRAMQPLMRWAIDDEQRATPVAHSA